MVKLKASIIGCGRVSSKHIEGLINNYSKIDLVSVCDINTKRMDKVIKEYLNKTKNRKSNKTKNIKKYNDYIEMLDKEDIDLVAILTENGLHAKHAIECMKRGKHVLVEKPMALSIEDANEMIRIGKEKNVKIGVCLQQRFNPIIQKVKKAIEDGKFGKVFSITGRILWNRDNDYYKEASWRGTKKFDGGALMNQFIHNIDLLQWLMDSEVDSVAAEIDTFLHDIESEDLGAVLIRFKNKSIGIVEGNLCVYPRSLEETLSIFGEKGTVVIGGFLDEIKVWKFKDEMENMDYNFKVDRNYGHSLLYKDFIEAIIENREPLINGEEGKKSLKIILSAYKSQELDKKIKVRI